MQIAVGPLRVFSDGQTRRLKLLTAGLAAAGAVAAFLFASPMAEGILKEGVLYLFGGASIVAGFVVLRKKRMIENVPASRVRSVAMGLAELVGTVREKTQVVAPLTRTPCCYYRFTIEKETGGKNKRWTTVEQGESAEPFYLEDPTGRILVDPAGADTVLRTAHREVRRDGGMFGARRRYTEWRLIDGQRIYILGSVRKQRDLARESREALHDRLRALKKDPKRLAEFDSDRNGVLDDPEWQQAVDSTRQDLLREEAARPPAPPEADLVIGRGETETTFVIADRGEKHLVRSLNLQVAIAFVLGVLFVLIPTVSLLARAGILPSGLALGRGTSIHVGD